jgi:hypothetical protein
MSTVLSALYQPWIDELLGGPTPVESRATCSECVMLDRPGAPPLEYAFSPQTKCCTYTPNLPNFVVGRILGRRDVAGGPARAFLTERIASRVGVTPLGVSPPLSYQRRYAGMAETTAFGRTASMRCPLYLEEGGLCGIWQDREAICSTWFCKQDRGLLGKTFWHVLEAWLRAMERELRLWCAGRAGLAPEPLAEVWSVLAERLDQQIDEHAMNDVADPAAYRRVWGEAGADPAAYFARCAELVSPLRLADVLAIGGASLAAAGNAVRVVYERMKVAALPERVSLGPTLVQIGRRPGQLSARHVALRYDWLDLPVDLVGQLGRFEHAPVARVLEELHAEGVAVDADLVQRLLDWQVLAPGA